MVFKNEPSQNGDISSLNSHLPSPISHLVNSDTDFQSGQIAFERGEYRQAVGYFLAAIAQVQPNTPIGGEIQIWLATAYEAAGEIPEAKALCQKLSNHPNLDTRQASKRMLYIMQAPELTRRDEWLIKIPDLTHIEDAEGNFAVNSTPILPSKAKAKSLDEIYAPVDLSQVNTQDNGFIYVALVSIVITLLGLWFVAKG
jgi:tetratricopeptide (TPR) repeat protein